MPDEEGPLTEADFEEMKDRLAALDKADRLIEQSIRAGIDMSEQQQASRELREKILRLKQSFFPGR